MSLCPLARQCELLWNPVISALRNIIDLHVNYLAYIDSRNNSFRCNRGPGECEGNLQQLCAHANYPNNYTWWNFIQCQTTNQQQIPTNGRSCATLNGMNYDKVISPCVTGSEGNKLFKDSIIYSFSKRVLQSCTVNVNDVNCFIKDPKEIVKYVCSLYQGNDKPPACKN